MEKMGLMNIPSVIIFTPIIQTLCWLNPGQTQIKPKPNSTLITFKDSSNP